LYKLIFLVIIIFVLQSCTTKDKEEKIEPLSFKVDSSLVSEKVTDDELGISFLAPKDWNKISDSLIKSTLKIAVQNPDPAVKTEETPVLKYGYIKNDDNSILLISKIPKNDREMLNKKIGMYADYYSKKDTSTLIKTTKFISNGFIVHQIMIVDSKNVLFKMIFTNEELPFPAQFDFIIPQSVYEKYIKTIESVSGSIYKITKK
jgi:hypothetical protein